MYFVMKFRNVFVIIALASLLAVPAAAQRPKRQTVGKSSDAKVRQASETENGSEKIPDDRITIHELKRKMDKKEAIVIIDARSGNAYIGSSVKITGSIHITLDELQSRMSELPRDKEIIAYCT
jgi:hypothetical protein